MIFFEIFMLELCCDFFNSFENLVRFYILSLKAVLNNVFLASSRRAKRPQACVWRYAMCKVGEQSV